MFVAKQGLLGPGHTAVEGNQAALYHTLQQRVSGEWCTGCPLAEGQLFKHMLSPTRHERVAHRSLPAARLALREAMELPQHVRCLLGHMGILCNVTRCRHGIHLAQTGRQTSDMESDIIGVAGMHLVPGLQEELHLEPPTYLATGRTR